MNGSPVRRAFLELRVLKPSSQPLFRLGDSDSVFASIARGLLAFALLVPLAGVDGLPPSFQIRLRFRRSGPRPAASCSTVISKVEQTRSKVDTVMGRPVSII
jgi:hypothetical protein